MNRIVLIGRFTKDPELRNTGGGTSVTNFVLAVDRNFKNSQGEREADFISVVAWRQLAELICNYMGKGRQIAVEGRLQTRSYDNEEGKRVFVTEVVAESVKFLDRPKENDQQQQSNNTYNRGPSEAKAQHQVKNNVEESKEEENDLFDGLTF